MTVRTVFERSKIPLTKWLAALFLMTACKKGVSAHQVHRMLGISYKSTWFMMHRLREAMRTGGLEPHGRRRQIVEADETYFGNAEATARLTTAQGRPYTKRGKLARNKRPILALVERGGQRPHVPCCGCRSGRRVAHIVRENIARESRLHTDESNLYTQVGKEFAAHETVKHTAKRIRRAAT